MLAHVFFDLGDLSHSHPLSGLFQWPYGYVLSNESDEGLDIELIEDRGVDISLYCNGPYWDIWAAHLVATRF